MGIIAKFFKITIIFLIFKDEDSEDIKDEESEEEPPPLPPPRNESLARSRVDTAESAEKLDTADRKV